METFIIGLAGCHGFELETKGEKERADLSTSHSQGAMIYSERICAYFGRNFKFWKETPRQDRFWKGNYDYGKKHEAIEDLPRNLRFRKETRGGIDFGKKFGRGSSVVENFTRLFDANFLRKE
jgi:hypothetical protein